MDRYALVSEKFLLNSYPFCQKIIDIKIGLNKSPICNSKWDFILMNNRELP
jgi:hypothetical protein